MVDFGGWDMPLQYPTGILAEHRQVRTDAGIFDVSHMGEVDFVGEKAVSVVDALVTNDVSKLVDNRALYTVACRPDGGIVDDCIVYRLAPEHLRIVVNASNIAKDVAFFREHAPSGCEIIDRSSEFALIAVQGPRAVALVADLVSYPLHDVPSFGLGAGRIQGADVLAARTGYTGEDGFELFVEAAAAPAVWNALLRGGAQPAGLGARDTLRLEARLCLYGNDIDETTNPYEAGLGWVVKLDKSAAFVGQDALREVKQTGVARKLIGFRLQDRGVARHGAEVVDDTGATIGHVTSGSSAPTVGGAVGMAYVPKAMATSDTPLQIRQRGRTLQATVVKGPFYRRSQEA